jgi:hypothetical protein
MRDGVTRIAMVCLPGGDATAHPRRIVELSAALARQGHQVTMYTSEAASSLIGEWDAAHGVDVVYGPPTPTRGCPSRRAARATGYSPSGTSRPTVASTP